MFLPLKALIISLPGIGTSLSVTSLHITVRAHFQNKDGTYLDINRNRTLLYPTLHSLDRMESSKTNLNFHFQCSDNPIHKVIISLIQLVQHYGGVCVRVSLYVQER